MKKYNQFIKEELDNDEDFDYLDSLFSKKEEFSKGDDVIYDKDGSEYDGKSATFIEVRDDGKYSIKFEDGKRLAVNSNNVHKPGTSKNKKIPDIPDERIGSKTWGPGSFDLPDSFFGGKNAPPASDKKKGLSKFVDKIISGFKSGDRIIYNKENSEHNGKTGIFVENKDDGKCSIRLDDGKKLAVNPKNISVLNNISKDSIILSVSEDDIIKVVVLDNKNEIYEDDIRKEFPELNNIGFKMISNGTLEYTGDLTKDELIDELVERDFRIIE